ncbi:murein L,D-transpeptidase catalytic domain family protein [Bdellovibrio sp. GT3]|uniref:murein L,D-transpeptidase catalytic domain family protein n=1 Tax=Bdellovibrio sp. GT3 TaxID=3136282 RepID=UPI0030EFDAFE
MTFKATKNVLALLSVTFLMAACAKGGFESSSTVLADDPDTEQSAGDTAQTIPPAEPEVPDTGTDTGTDTGSNTGSEPTTDAQILAKYSYVDTGKTVNQTMLKNALLYYHKNLKTIKNSDYLSVLDFSLSSTKKRFHIINMKTGEVWSIHVAHGKGSDPDHDGYANSFSNVSGSNASSLGIYKTAETYSGSHGYSLRLDGLSSTNSKARSRAVVIHGADYVSESSVIQGRSWGCPAVTMSYRTKVIDMVKGGSIIYASATK